VCIHVSASQNRTSECCVADFLSRFRCRLFKLSSDVQGRIEARIDRLGMTLDRFSHTRLKGVESYRLRVGDYRVIYEFDISKGQLYLLSVGHRREVYRR
jgi:mRNA interferase RelE/StbE